MMDFILIPELFQKVVDRVNENLSTRAVDPFEVYYEYGHYAEIVSALKEKDGSITKKNSKYPLFWLVMDFVEKCGNIKDGYCLLPNMQILIATSTDPDLSTKDRIQKTFKPRLIPAYREFISQLSNSGFFYNADSDYTPHERILRPYWGGQESGNGQANIFNDFIDCIQIRNLQLMVNENVCNQFDL